MRFVSVILAAALCTSSLFANPAGKPPSRRYFICRSAILGAAAIGVYAFHREILDLFSDIPDRPIRPDQLTNEGISDDPLVNLRQKVANLHGVRVTAVIQGPNAVTQRQLGRFLTDFLATAGSADEKPMLQSLFPPRTVTVDAGVDSIRFRDKTVHVSWKLGAALVNQQYLLTEEALQLEKRIRLKFGFSLSRGMWVIAGGGILPMIHFEEYVACLRRFEELSKKMTREQFAKANFGALVLVGSETMAAAFGLPLMGQTIDADELSDLLNDVRDGTFQLPPLPQPPPALPPGDRV